MNPFQYYFGDRASMERLALQWCLRTAAGPCSLRIGPKFGGTYYTYHFNGSQTSPKLKRY